jgi:predicted GNAT family acetyltransferase
MVGFVEGPTPLLPLLLDTAIDWFAGFGADTWLEVDEFDVLWNHRGLLEERGFQLQNDWQAMLCRSVAAVDTSRWITVEYARTQSDLALAARIAEEADRGQLVGTDDAGAQRRSARFWREFSEWGSRFVVAWLDGQPAGTARLTDEELPVVVGVATLPAARGRGVATTITSMLTNVAVTTRGACALYADRGSQAARIYERIGYRPLFHLRAWLRPWGGGDTRA